MKRETILAQAGSRWDETTGALSMPIYQSATFRHPALGQSTGFDYSRSANPTRGALEATLAELDGAEAGFAFASGLAAIDAVLHLLDPGDRIVATEDLYGGTFRLLTDVFTKLGLTVDYVDTSRTEAVATALARPARALFVETPTNPLLKLADLEALAHLAKGAGALFIVDNTFLTPARLRPLHWGADIVVYSASKYLSGHNDVVGGAVTVGSATLAERVYYYQNAIGAVMGPMDSWLVLRGMKTLALRMARQEENAARIARHLLEEAHVTAVHYPGLVGHPGRERLSEQADGFGGMLAFEVDDPARVAKILERVGVFHFAESLGGVESLITFPAAQTHADMAPELRERLGIHDRLLRVSVGIEDADDLIADLSRAING